METALTYCNDDDYNNTDDKTREVDTKTKSSLRSWLVWLLMLKKIYNDISIYVVYSYRIEPPKSQ